MPSSNPKYCLLLLVAFLAYQSWHTRIADAHYQYRVSPWMPGVGVSLTAHYAVVSTRKEDGSFEDVGRVEGSEAYVDMMRRYGAVGMGYTRDIPSHNDLANRFLRTIRKSVGLAASADVLILSQIIKDALSQPSTSLLHLPLVISYPAIPGLSQRDILDAATYLGIHVLSGYHMDQPRTNIAAYAGHGLGLCPNYDDFEACKAAALQMPVRDALLVEVSERALLMHADTMWEADQAGGFDMYVFAEFGLLEEKGAEGIGEAVLKFMRLRYVDEEDIGQSPRITVMMTGSGVTKEVTEAVVRAVTVLCEEVTVLDEGPVYVAARGAAELAWRAVERPTGEEL